MAGLNELKERPADLELALPHEATRIGDRTGAVDGCIKLQRVRLGRGFAGCARGDVLIGRDPRAKVPGLVHSPHPLADEGRYRQALADGEARVLERLEEVEHPPAHEQHAVEDFLDLTGGQREELLPRDEAELDRGFAEPHLSRRRGVGAALRLVFIEAPVTIEHLTEPLAVHGGLSAHHLRLVEVEGPTRGAFEDQKLPVPARVAYETDDVAQRARRSNFARQNARPCLLSLGRSFAQHEHMRGRGLNGETPLPSLHSKRSGFPNRPGDPLGVDPTNSARSPAILFWRVQRLPAMLPILSSLACRRFREM